MKKIRIGNDFVFNWAIERGGLPEDLSSVLDAKLTVSVFGKKQEVPFTVSGNIITIEFTPEICNVIGLYNLLFTYILPDTGLSDEDRKCAVDVDAFQIVAKTAQADDSSEFSMTSDMAIAFKGDKGDSAYQVWLEEGNTGTEEDYFAYLRQPAVDAGASISELEGEIQVSEGLRVQAESERDLAEATRIQAESERLAAEIIRQGNESNRIENEAARVQNEAERISKENVRQSNEIDRVEAEGVRVQAENERAQAEVERQATIQEAVAATNLANEKANLANIAAQSANEAAGLADTARTELTTAVNTKLGEADDKIEEMDTTLSTYDGRVTQVESDITQLAGEINLSEIKLNQRVVNGNFANGTTAWENMPSLTIEDGFGKITSIGNTSGYKKISGQQNTKCYLIVKYKSDGQAQFQIAPRLFGTNIATPAFILTKVGTDWMINSELFTLSDTMDRFYLAVDKAGVIFIENMMWINLTEAFGAGNEPSRLEMDALFSVLPFTYFEGEITLTKKQELNWYLKMIRQNRNAIIALGGTII